MYELTAALKYLIPRWRQLSVSIISLISVIVIALVVWLIVVFFSVTHGLEKSWIQKMIALSAPVRVTPTEAYYESFYYKSDSISADADYTLKSISEKQDSAYPLAYNPEFDAEPPHDWPEPDKHASGAVKDLVKEVFDTVSQIPGARASDYEMTVANLNLKISKESKDGYMSQVVYVGSFEADNNAIQDSLVDVETENFETLLDPIPNASGLATGVLLPKNYQVSGVQVGDSGHLSYYTATASSMQEQRSPIYVAGFYDPGILSMGGKFVIANKELTNVIRTSFEGEDDTLAANGIHIRFNDFEQAKAIKNTLEAELKKRGIDHYWQVETYHEYDFSRDLVQQLKSEKFLFSILSTIIIIVACSNIISMLIILVNDKKTEIGILRAMGASSQSIAMIFGFCGVVMGLLGSAIGIIIAKLTLNNLEQVVGFISSLQGHQMFNPLFYGDTLPNEVSYQALLFVLFSTAIISLIAGIVPAIKASTVKPATILRAE